MFQFFGANFAFYHSPIYSLLTFDLQSLLRVTLNITKNIFLKTTYLCEYSDTKYDITSYNINKISLYLTRHVILMDNPQNLK